MAWVRKRNRVLRLKSAGDKSRRTERKKRKRKDCAPHEFINFTPFAEETL